MYTYIYTNNKGDKPEILFQCDAKTITEADNIFKENKIKFNFIK